MTRPVYLDHHATTPLDPRVLEAMLPFLRERFGNPSSRTHTYGWEARRAVGSARAAVASLVGAEPDEIVFTSGATESVNLALKGALAVRRGRLVVGATEHRAVLDASAALAAGGAPVTRLAVDSRGRLDPEDLQRALGPETRLVSLMAANNEVGTLHPLDRLIPFAASCGALFHSDASQAVGKVPLDVRALRVDLMSFTAHKLYGPKGAGALFVRRGVARSLTPQIHGGGQEGGLRSGTLNVPAVVGFGAAAEIASREMETESERLRALRDRFLAALQGALTGVVENGDPDARLPGNLSVSIAGIDGEALLAALPGIAASTGSACESESRAPSHVLTALGLSPERIRGSLRFGLGRFNTEEEIDRAALRIADEVRRLRALSKDLELQP
jgi:cysteine desulfurase